MSIADSVSQIFLTLQAVKDTLDPASAPDTALPVITAPQWWIDEVATAAALNAGHDAPVPLGFEIYGCTVLLQDGLAEPFMVAHDGKIYPVLPQWQRDALGVGGRVITPTTRDVVQ